MSANIETRSGKAVGCLIGGMCGDVLGKTVEFKRPEQVAERFPEGLKNFQVCRKTGKLGLYTDDTEMTIALAKSIVMAGRSDASVAAAQYGQHYSPARGYGKGARKVMQLLQQGADHKTTAKAFFPEGSYGNGGAMRIAPVSIAYRHAPLPVLRQAVKEAILCTHAHPEGMDGALVQAAALVWLYNVEDPSSVSPLQLLEYLHTVAETGPMLTKLQQLQAALSQAASSEGFWLDLLTESGRRPLNWKRYLASPHFKKELKISSSLADWFQIRAPEAVAVALLILCCHWEHPEDAIIAAVHHGGDADTIAAIVGNLVGALHGCRWIPERWWIWLENTDGYGRDELMCLAERLADMDVVE